MNNMNLKNIQNKSLNGEFLSREEAKSILNYPEDKLNDILDIVYPIRQKYKDNNVSIQILTNAKSRDCSQDCKYCAQSCKSKADIVKYSIISYDKLFNNTTLGQLKNVWRHCVGFSGLRFSDEQIDIICEYFLELKNSIKTDICCSIGFLTEKQAIKLKNSGINRINHNLNTGKNNYKNICSTYEYNERLENIKMLQRVGFEICCGGIIGLGETDDDIIDMFFDIKI